jgi:hypothetical protein
MRNEMAQRVVEQLLMNLIVNSNVRYLITGCSQLLHADHQYIVHRLRADIEEDRMWFGDDNIPDLPISLIEDVDITDTIIMITLSGGGFIKMEVI